MAHFAELDANNKVLRVVTVDNENVSADMAVDGEEWCASNIEEDASIPYVDGAYPGVRWKQTSYNHNFRKRFAAIGGYFIDEGDGYFTGVKQYDNWVLNTTDGAYYPPVDRPTDQNYTDGDKTYLRYIQWDQDNTRYICTKVIGNDTDGWQRHNVNTGLDEIVESPTDDQKAVLVWNPDTSTWS